jgi:S-adenosylmethionine:tRNA-ribosyltransferase-isomerase (queuine synthetase)
MKTKELDYHLPKELIAAQPIVPRDAAKLMIIDRPITR